MLSKNITNNIHSIIYHCIFKHSTIIFILNVRIDGIVSQRQEKMATLTSRTDKQNEDRVADIEGLRTRLAVDSAYMEALASKTMGVFFSAYRSDILHDNVTMCHTSYVTHHMSHIICHT